MRSFLSSSLATTTTTSLRGTTNSSSFSSFRGSRRLATAALSCWILTATSFQTGGRGVHCFSVAAPFVSSAAVTRRSRTTAATFRGGADTSCTSGNSSSSKSRFWDFTAWWNRPSRFSSWLPRFLSTSTAEDMSTTTTKNSMTAGEKLAALRQRMRECNLDLYLIPTDDPHLSEYTPEAYKRRGFLTGFDGSAGTAVVTAAATASNGEDAVEKKEGEAHLWTDSRYWNQAAGQLDADHWTLQKAGLPTTLTIPKWLAEHAVQHYQQHQQPLKIGFDPFIYPASFPKEVMTAMEEAAKDADLMEAPTNGNGDVPKSSKPTPATIGVLDTSHENLIDPIWNTARPPVPASPFRVHPLEYAGVSVADKIRKVRKAMKEEKKATLSVFSALDDVAYLFNLRSQGDIDTCPVGIAYATVGLDDVTLYCDAKKVESSNVQEHLKEVTIKPYDQVVADITQHCQESTTHKVWLDKSRSNCALVDAIPDPETQLVNAQNSIVPMKACKNTAEMQGMRTAHLQDGAAMAQFMAWLEDTVVNQEKTVSEVEIDLKLTGYRAQQPGFVEVSFPTIAGVGPNGAIVHYRAEENSSLLRYLDRSNPILIDSGGQYLFGTTDVTRTWHFGEPTAEFMEAYTRVLKGHIGVDMMTFPENTPGFVLDVFARRWLWHDGKDYGHGTGHGVGAALNVHEGPQSISPRWTNKEGLKKGMILSNEPGYYEDGNFGVRIENLLELKYVNPEDNVDNDDDETDDSKKSGKKKFLKFDRLTFIPIQKNLIDMSLMTTEELDWLDEYHAAVYEKISPLLEADSAAMAWLTKSCAKIDRSP